MLPVLPSPVGECLCLLALFCPCSCCLSSPLQLVSASACLLSFAPAHAASPPPSTRCGSLLACSLLPLLMLPVLPSRVRECLCLLALFCPCSCCLSSPLQWVSASPCLLSFASADAVCPPLSRT